MVSSTPSIQVYCTRPSCDRPINSISEASLNSSARTEIRCANCEMPLILDGHFLPLRLLVPDEERGGFGRTFLAQDINFPQRPRRVIKQLYPKNTPGNKLDSSVLGKIEELFHREAMILAELSHQQIPRAWAFFVVEVEHQISHQQRFFYLVQDYIEGQNLEQELKERVQAGKQFSEDEVINILKEILTILRYVHHYDDNSTTIHRDIKPANIMRRSSDGRLYLIDFGAVKQVVIERAPTETSSKVITPGFAPPEQSAGEMVSPASDLFALAATCLRLLTGSNPSSLIWNSNWKNHTTVRNERFATVLDWMLKYRQEDRPQSAQEVLDALSTAQQPFWQKFFDGLKSLTKIPKRWRWISFGFLALFVAAIAILPHLKYPRSLDPKSTATPTQTQTSTPPPPFAEYFSRGEEALIQQKKETLSLNECRKAYNSKQTGIDAFKQASSSKSPDKFREAEKYFKQATNEFRSAFRNSPPNNKCEVDPETWIYYYNSKAAITTSKISLPTIAVVIPSLEEHRDIALEMLRGVAQVIEQNQDMPFQVLIAKENSDDKEEVKKIANFIYSEINEIPGDFKYFENSKILGVIGHITSSNTWLAGSIYEKKQLVLISPTSTAVRNGYEYVFRTASDDFIAAGDLANYVADKLQGEKVLILFDEDEYSKSLKEQFKNTLIHERRVNRQYIEECNLSLPENQGICSEKARTAKALMLATSRKNLDEALKIAKFAKQNHELRNQQLPLLLGGDVFYSRKTLEKLENYANGMVVAVSSHANLASQEFTKKAQELWWTTKVSWRTLTSYDAAQAFVTAVTDIREKNLDPTRQLVYERLKNNNFSATGATTKVRFEYGDRKLITKVGVLVQVDRNNENNSDEYNFTLVRPIPQRQE
ncbi:serine/threonine protein kinase [Calothrix sp. NIES-2100]|uniref:bifunctional serine/threonine-protein kinase/ABC transporter substrate-binding protein n=1 Tax=Calothrix sp. NIES-2100 TaxID=1954172 RepID=UPI000B5EED4A|nr:serine/threonine protein kinase [Calothrix sp. NIES-2100]